MILSITEVGRSNEVCDNSLVNYWGPPSLGFLHLVPKYNIVILNFLYVRVCVSVSVSVSMYECRGTASYLFIKKGVQKEYYTYYFDTLKEVG